MSGVIPIVLAIDVESDARHAPPGGGVDVSGLERTVEAFGQLRRRLEQATSAPVRFAWFVRMDPQVSAQGGRPDALVECAPAAFAAIQAASDVIGLHTHAGRWDPARGWWVADYGDPTWVDRCLTSSAQAFEARFGQSCREHRFGDRFSSATAFDQLAMLGVVVDLTTEPGQRATRAEGIGEVTGAFPDYSHAARTAHLAGDPPFSILPLTSADPAPSLPWAWRWLRRMRYVGQPRHRTLLLDRSWRSPGLLWDLAEAQLESGVTHLAFAIRSDLILHPRWAGASAVLESLLQRPLVRQLVFVGGEGAVARSGALLARSDA